MGIEDLRGSCLPLDAMDVKLLEYLDEPMYQLCRADGKRSRAIDGSWINENDAKEEAQKRNATGAESLWVVRKVHAK